MIRFTCPACKSVLESPPHKGGDKVACPKCGQRLLIPNPVKPAARNKTVLGEELPSPHYSFSKPKLDWSDEVRIPHPQMELGADADNPSPVSITFRCPQCGSQAKPKKWRVLPPVSWLMFVLLLLFCLPLFWLPFLLYESWHQCSDCRYSYRAGPITVDTKFLVILLASFIGIFVVVLFVFFVISVVRL
jgi:DNA-directed RNA polymerase subunit M/transcription elongation factor TFIIS